MSTIWKKATPAPVAGYEKKLGARKHWWNKTLPIAALSLLLSAGVALAQQPLPVIAVDHGPNAKEVLSRPYVVLVSLDGFRYDFVKKYQAGHLLELAKNGAWAVEGMVPSYPSLTFPNHLTLITGLYPEHHGIVANNFYDPERKQRYSINNDKTVLDGSWYGGVPLWVLAEQQGMRSANLFWPGSDADIAGVRPSYYLKFDDKLDDERRVDQILEWLKLPEEKRPHFLTLYYSNVDHAGHDFGPDAPQTQEAVKHVDAMIGKLAAGLKATKLPVDLIVVSDHGMEKVRGSWITLDTFADLSNFETDGPQLYAKTEADAEKAYQKLKAASPDFLVYRRKNVPANLNFNSNPREGDPVIVPTGPFSIRVHAPASGKPEKAPMIGAHGFDPMRVPNMKALFLAQGADIKSGTTIKPFENVNVYPLIAHILGLKVGKIDGSLNILAGILRDEGNEAAQGANK